jgi:hypothetical protein
MVPALGPLSVRFKTFSVLAQTVSDGWRDRPFTETCPDDEDALMNEPARAGGEHASRSVCFLAR